MKLSHFEMVYLYVIKLISLNIAFYNKTKNLFATAAIR